MANTTLELAALPPAIAAPPAPAPAPVVPRARGCCLPFSAFTCPAPFCIPAGFQLPALLLSEAKFAWSDKYDVPFALVVLTFGLLLLAFSLWYWFGADAGIDVRHTAGPPRGAARRAAASRSPSPPFTARFSHPRCCLFLSFGSRFRR